LIIILAMINPLHDSPQILRFRLIPHWKYELSFRLIPHWTRLCLVIPKGEGYSSSLREFHVKFANIDRLNWRQSGGFSFMGAVTLIKRGYKLVTTFQMPETKKAYISVSP